MKDDNKSSIVKEAITDFKTIRDAAEINAKKRLAEEYPENFNLLLKEEINKNKKAKESYKKIDDAEESEESDENKSKKESDMNNQVKETVKVTNTVGKGKPFEQKPKSVEEDVKITNTVGKSDPFTHKKNSQKIEEERDKSFVGDIESDTPNKEKGSAKGIAFNSNVGKKQQPISNLKEEFDISELDTSSVGSAIDGADDNDEIITMNEIDDEISKMEEFDDKGTYPRPQLGGKLGSPIHQGGDAFSKLVSMRKDIDEMIKTMGGSGAEEEEGYQPEEESGITDEDINSILGSAPEEESYRPEEENYQPEEETVQEAHGVSHSAGTVKSSLNPRPEYLSTGEQSRRRFSKFNESDVKMGSLIGENKKLTKKLNETKKYKQSASTLIENYKTALEKYRNQLKEMAVFNTNLAHVNNLLVNESLALTHDDKIKIINEFKKVNSISESQDKYKTFLTEMKESKKTISESLEKKVSTSIQPSSKQRLDEVVEKTAYANDKHIQNMKRLINYVENRGKK